MPPKRGRGRGRGRGRIPQEDAPGDEGATGTQRPSGAERFPSQQPYVPPQRGPPDQGAARPPRPSGAGRFPSQQPYVPPQARATSREQPYVPPQARATSREVTSPTPSHVEALHRQEKPQKKKEKPIKVSPSVVGLELEFKEKLSLQKPFPKNPGPGRLGRRIRLISNCYKIDIPHGNIYHYDVEIFNKRFSRSETTGTVEEKKYRCLNTKRNREIVNVMLRSHDQFRGVHAAYDGRKNLYTRNPLKIAVGSFLRLDVVMEMEDREGAEQATDTYEVTIQPTQKEDVNSCAISLETLHEFFEGRCSDVSQEAIMALETILRHGPCLKYIPVTRSFYFSNPDGSRPLDTGKEIWSGYHQSVRIGQWPMVNIDLSATTFYKAGPVIDFISEVININPEGLRRMPNLTDPQRVSLIKKLKSLKVETTHLRYRRKYKIIRLTIENAAHLEFSLTVNGQTVRKKVKDYFFEQYNIKLRYPNLPCLQVAPESKGIFLPLEICDISEGQHCKEKLSKDETAEMIKFTTRPPGERFDIIEDIVQGANFDSDEVVSGFGLRVSDRPLTVNDARILEAPNLLYGENQVKPFNGAWNMRERKFYDGAQIKNWVLLSFCHPRVCNKGHLNKFATLLCSIARNSGLFINSPQLIDIRNFNQEPIRRLLKSMQDNYQAELAIIVLPLGDKEIYNNVKKTAETILGLTTQCVCAENVVKKCNPALVSNLSLKINAKMGGTNNILNPGETPRIFEKPIIICGADVTHPGPSRGIKPSIAAVVASLNKDFSRYAVTCKAQRNMDTNKKSIEIIVELKVMMKELLKAFYRSTNKKKPEKIIFYRDGVSEGQFKTVRLKEVEAIREACREIESGYEPGITFVIVQKRHHVRFIPQDPREAVKNNVPPGTTVDTVITHPLNFNFFLCSQQGLQGTSRPCHYTVIEDDNNFTADDLQKMSYYLCHINVRCTKSVSVPAPVAYAHLAAYRTSLYISTNLEEMSADSDSSEASFLGFPQAMLDSIQVLDVMKNTMYFV